MAIPLHLGHHVPRSITTGLRLRQVDVITAYEDGSALLDDASLLDRAGALGRVLFTQDDDLVVEATRRQREGLSFTGVVYAHQLRVTIGQCVGDLEVIAKAAEPEDLANRIEFLPLRRLSS
jgi:hypothetical protein